MLFTTSTTSETQSPESQALKQESSQTLKEEDLQALALSESTESEGDDLEAEIEEQGKQEHEHEHEHEKESEFKVKACDLEKRAGLKKLFGHLDPTRLNKVINLLTELRDLKVKKAQELEKEQALHQAKLLKALSLLKEQGVLLEDFKDFLGSKDFEVTLKNSKYQYLDENGVPRFWSGQGKIPSSLAQIMARDGTTKEDYLRDKD